MTFGHLNKAVKRPVLLLLYSNVRMPSLTPILKILSDVSFHNGNYHENPLWAMVGRFIENMLKNAFNHIIENQPERFEKYLGSMRANKCNLNYVIHDLVLNVIAQDTRVLELVKKKLSENGLELSKVIKVDDTLSLLWMNAHTPIIAQVLLKLLTNESSKHVLERFKSCVLRYNTINESFIKSMDATLAIQVMDTYEACRGPKPALRLEIQEKILAAQELAAREIASQLVEVSPPPLSPRAVVVATQQVDPAPLPETVQPQQSKVRFAGFRRFFGSIAAGLMTVGRIIAMPFSMFGNWVRSLFVKANT